MPDNEAERPTTAPPEPVAADDSPAAGDAPSDPITTGVPEAKVRPHRQRPHRSARTRLVRRRSARRMQHGDSTTPAQPRLTRRRQHSEASSTGPGPRRRLRSQRPANGTSATQRPTNRTADTARKPAARSGRAAPRSNGSANGSARRSRRNAETELQPAAHTGGRKASRLTRSASYRALGKDTPTIEPVPSGLGRPLQLSAKPWSSLGTPTSGSNASASGATYRALGRSGGGGEHTAPTEAPGTAVYRSLGRSSLPMHRAQSPLHQSNAAKDRSKAARPATRPTRRSRLRRASQRPRPSRANAAARSDD